MSILTILLASIGLVLFDAMLIKCAGLTLIQCSVVCFLAMLAAGLVCLIFNMFTNQK